MSTIFDYDDDDDNGCDGRESDDDDDDDDDQSVDNDDVVYVMTACTYTQTMSRFHLGNLMPEDSPISTFREIQTVFLLFLFSISTLKEKLTFSNRTDF